MIDFVMNNMGAIGSGLVAIVLIVYALVTRQWLILRSAALSFMLSAERLMTTAEGKAKFEVVLTALWDQVPSWIKKFYDKNRLKAKLQNWYDLAKNALE